MCSVPYYACNSLRIAIPILPVPAENNLRSFAALFIPVVRPIRMNSQISLF